MPLPANVIRRGAAYYWRRSLVIAGHPTTVALSLLTKESVVARHRGARMTARSEELRMSLYERVRTEGLTPGQQGELLRSELARYRNALDHEVTRWETSPELRDVSDTSSDLHVFEELWTHIARHGVADDLADDAHLRRHIPHLDPLERQRLGLLLAATPGFKTGFFAEVTAALVAAGISPTSTNLAMGGRIVATGRAVAAAACAAGVMPIDASEEPLPSRPVAADAPVTSAMPIAPTSASPTPFDVPAQWAHMGPVDVARAMIEADPKMFEHRRGGRRASEQIGEQSERQIIWAAMLLQKSMPPGTPMWQRTSEDVVELDRWLDRLPVTCGKSPRHREPDCTLAMIEAEALEQLETGEIDASAIGFTSANSNKHFRKLGKIDAFLRKAIPGLPPVDFASFCVPDLKSERDARLRLSLEQGEAIFRLAPWTGCSSVVDRLTAGPLIIHDGLFWVLLLVWYTGARREEICKLLVLDVECLNGIWFIRIANTETGRVKTTSSVRIIAVCDELVRLGFIAFVQAMKAAGEKLLFPELMPGGATKRKLGDVFYKLWWIYIAPLVTPALGRGQAMHACRHTVSDELKQAEIFLETRNDLLGWKGKGGEGETRYPSATALGKLKSAVDQIPVVTTHLPALNAGNVRLLDAKLRVARPTRTQSITKQEPR